MTFRFQEDDVVVLKDSHTDFLPAGSRGVILCPYVMSPPAYEVNFRDTTGEFFGAIMYEDEIEYEDEVEAARGQAAFPGREAVGAA